MLKQKGVLMSHVSKEVQKLCCFQVWCVAEAQMMSKWCFLFLWLCFLGVVPFLGWVTLMVAGWLHFHLVSHLHTFNPSGKTCLSPRRFSRGLLESQWFWEESCPLLNQSLFVQENARLWLARPGSHAMPRSALSNLLRLGMEDGARGWEGVDSPDRILGLSLEFWWGDPPKSKFPLSNA